MTSFNLRSTSPPLTIPGVAFWADATDIAGNGQTFSNGSMSSWIDKSGWANSGSQATGANQPTFLNNQLNGLPGVSFNGTTTSLSSITSRSYINGGSNGMTCFAVASTNAPNVRARIWAAGSTSISCGCSTNDYILTTGGVKDYLSSSSGWVANTPQIATYVFNNSTFATSFYQNGTLFQTVAGTANGNISSSTLILGEAGGSGGEYWSGLIFELILLFRICTASEITLINRYLGDKWGIVSA